MKRYHTIVADPPWPQSGGPLRGSGAGEGFQFAAPASSKPLPYPTMSFVEIRSIKIPAAPDAHLFLWATNRSLEASFKVARFWGFTPSTTLVWCKATMGGGLGGDAFGISTEFVLFCRRGSLPATSRISRTWFDWKRPYDARGKPMHSAKPEAFLDLVEQVSPGPYLELFARRNRLGWDTWGNEALNHVDLEAS